MRTFPLLLALLIATFALATTAHALPLPAAGAPTLPHTAALDPEGEAEAEEAEEEGDEFEACESEDEEGEEAEAEEADEGEEEAEEGEADLCEEEAEEEECDFESASATVAANSANGHVRITVRYRTFTPSPVNLDYSLHGGKGGLHLGGARAHFHRAGVFHDSLTVGGKKLAKLEAAHQFVVTVQAAGTPGYCEERLTAQAPHRASRRHRAGARGRSGGPARTPGS